ncbi:MAG: hypothetical protein ACKVU4_14510 [Phycisphaerales bacterium]
MIALVARCLVLAVALAQDRDARPAPRPVDPAAQPLTTAIRGITGTAEFSATGPSLRGHAGQTLAWPLVARVVAAEPLPGGPEGGNHTRYRVAFIGTIAGDYDLRDCLQRQDGSALDLPPLPVRILSQLEADPGTDLFSSADVPPLTASRYRPLMLALAAAWVGVPVVYVLVRLARRRPAPPPPPVIPPPTLADQLRPLVEAAIRGTLSVADRGRLELLLYLYWRARLALAGPQTEVISILRTHPRAGALLQAVERWLHAPRAAADHAETEAAALLEPYRDAPAIPEPQAAEARA